MVASDYNTQWALQRAVALGWALQIDRRHDRRHDRGTVMLSRQDDRLYVATNEHWFCLTVPLAITGQPDTELCHQLALASRRCFLCKFAIDQCDQTVLQLELPFALIDSASASRSVEAITYYLDQHRYLIQRSETTAGKSLAIETPEVAGTQARPGPAEMEFCSEKEVASCFALVSGDGWRLKDHLRSNQWYATYRNADRKFDTYLVLDACWAYFQMPLSSEFGKRHMQSPICRSMLEKYLLRINEQVYWAKFGLDEDGEVLLSLDMPRNMFGLEMFRRAASMLAAYADEFSYEVQVVCSLDNDQALQSRLHSHGEHQSGEISSEAVVVSVESGE